MTKLNMLLNKNDIEKIKKLKTILGIRRNSDLVRYLLKWGIEKK